MARENTLDRHTALQLLTAGGWSLVREKGKGSIKAGHAADLVILNKDYFTVADEEIKTITATLTIVDGKVVYGDTPFKGVAPAVLPVIPAWSPVKYFGGYQ